MSDVDWPEREVFFARLDELKAAAGIKYDSSLAERAGAAPPLVEHWLAGGQAEAITGDGGVGR